MKDKRKEQIMAYIVMGIYMLFLCWVILFKLADSIDKIPSRRGINLIPFYYDQFSGTTLQKNDILFNIALFVPVGFYFTVFKKGKIVSGILLSALLSLLFEIVQWIFSLGSSDITDLITNIMGGIIGTLMFIILNKLSKGREVKIVNIIGAVLEVCLIVLLILLSIF